MSNDTLKDLRARRAFHSRLVSYDEAMDGEVDYDSDPFVILSKREEAEQKPLQQITPCSNCSRAKSCEHQRVVIHLQVLACISFKR